LTDPTTATIMQHVRTGSSPGYETLEEAVAIAQELAPRLRQRVAQAEAERRLPAENVRDLLDSGLIGLEVPKRFGGAELNLDALLEVTAALAEGCSSTGWVYALWGAHMWLIGQYPEAVQEEIFADPDLLVSSVVNVEGTPVKVEGGYRWTGRGFFSSGVDHCTWMSASLNLQPGEFPGDIRWFLMPRSDIEIVDDWHTVGLKGTGSKTIVVNDVFIPDERVLAFKELSEGNGYGAKLYGSPVYRAAFDFTYTLPLGGPAIGIARAMLRTYEERAKARMSSGAVRQRGVDAAALQRMARAGADIDAAMSLLLETAREVCYIPAADATPIQRQMCRTYVAYAAQLCRAASNSLFEASGGSAIYEDRDLQRLWRDSNVAGAHMGLNWDSAAQAYGRTLVGLPPFAVPAPQAG
jgi:3-hydroxy-9,10-secoandrosta-1,3,5(10)-triene-9,17-dione monooxygenase